MVNVQIDENRLLEMFLDRVSFWTHNSDIKNLYEVYYADLIGDGYFEGKELDIYRTVDNDYMHNFRVYDSIDDIMRDFNASEEEARERIVSECDGSYLVNMH